MPETAAPLPVSSRASLPAGLVALFIFICLLVVWCPRFFLLKGLGIPEIHADPELHRMIWSLQKLDHPFTPVENTSNIAINWRLFFPTLGHVLHLRPEIYFALAPLGVLIVLNWITRQTHLRSNSLLAAGLTAFLLGGCSWFFVGTGWIGYFDAWTCLALLLCTFSTRHRVLIACGLIAPWIDERFLLGLPLVLIMRVFFHYPENPNAFSKIRPEWKVLVWSVLPYLILRLLWLTLGRDPHTLQYLKTQTAHGATPMTLLMGTWQGLRWAWIFAGLFLFFCLRQKKTWLIKSVLVMTALGTLVVHGSIAADISRSMAVFVPAALAGVWMLQRQKPALTLGLLALASAGNLASPARHVVTTFQVPIEPLWQQVHLYKNPPHYLQADYYVNRARQAQQEKSPLLARRDLHFALTLDPDFLPALYDLGCSYQASGDPKRAAFFWNQALSQAPLDWSLRGDLESRIAKLDNAGDSD